MRKAKAYIVLLIMFIAFSLIPSLSRGKDKNVLSYYAINNSIDGQPMIGTENILRFFPVFIYRCNIKSVKVTLYIGSTIFTQNAVKYDKGSCWEVLLPKFELNQSIQRYEVETIMEIPKDLTISLLDSLNKNITSLKEKSALISAHLKGLMALKIQSNSEFSEITKNFKEISDQYEKNEKILKFREHDSTDINDLINRIYLDTLSIDTTLKTSTTWNNDTLKRKLVANLKSYVNTVRDSVPKFLREKSRSDETFYYEKLKAFVTNAKFFGAGKDSGAVTFNGLVKKIDSDQIVARILLDNIRSYNENLADKVREEIHRNLIDTAQSGKGVLIGDIIVTNMDTIQQVKILYRNYNPENRRLPALDPVEKLSIYRIRYVPFPVIGNRLAGPFEKNVPIVFEAGITFGNVTLSSNESLLSPFSYQRFGISIAFTPLLFSPDAQIKAIALTYDFNAYASLSGGVNFGTLSDSNFGSYFSLGINFKAFQLLLNNTKKIFNK